ncbi:MAG: zinc-dependent metalloprotease family protein [Marmoricola sp.]
MRRRVLLVLLSGLTAATGLGIPAASAGTRAADHAGSAAGADRQSSLDHRLAGSAPDRALHSAPHRASGPALLPRADTRLVAHAAHGDAAVRALGAQLDDAAARNAMSTAGLRGLLQRDHTAWVDPTGRVFFKEAPVPAALATSGATAGPVVASDTATDVFALHSLPGSTHTIYLNFVGMYVGGTSWNSTALPDATYPGFSLDSDATRFSSTERADIQEIWERVAAAYAPFDVDVTTQAPATADALTRTSSTDPTYGTAVLITSSTTAETAICGGGCGGVAFLDTFAQDRDGSASPAWVFTDGAAGSITYVAQSAEHEVGHTFGLVHDGIVTSSGFQPYYGGHGLWGPIMGGGDARAVYQFNDGDYPGAQIQSSDPTVTYQDDLAVIARSAPRLPDEAGDTTATAMDLGAAADYTRTGLIGTRADVDVYALTRTCSGTLTVTAAPTVQNAPLDLAVMVLDSSGHQVATAAPASSAGGTYDEPLALDMGASVAPSAGPGTYYVEVEGVGVGTTSTGYSDYDSLGAYRLTASGCPTTPTAAPTSPAPTSPAPTSPAPTTPTATTPTTAPFVPTPAALSVRVDRLHRRISAAWSDANVPPAGTHLLSWEVRLQNTATHAGAGTTLGATARSQAFAGVPTGGYLVTVRSHYSDGTSATTSGSAVMPAPVRPTSPQGVHGHQGRRGGPVTARATWAAPASSGSYPVIGYQVAVVRLAADHARVLSVRVLPTRYGAAARAATLRLPRSAAYRIRVRAVTAAGASTWSPPSRVVRGR